MTNSTRTRGNAAVRVTRAVILTAVLVFTGIPAAANATTDSAAETTAAPKETAALKESAIHVRSEFAAEVPNVPDNCPFSDPSLLLGAYLYSYRVDGSGAVVNPKVKKVGTAATCSVVHDPDFSPGSKISHYGVFDLAAGRLVVRGECTVTAQDTPAQGVHQAGCAMNIVSGPPGFAGGISTSSSVLNVGGAPGIGTGSYWNFRIWTKA